MEKTKDWKTFLNKDWNIAAGVITALLLEGMLMVYYLWQVRQGVGEYLAESLHLASAELCDALMVLARLNTLLIAFLIPCLTFKRKGVVPFLHIVEIYFSFVPNTHMDAIVQYFNLAEFRLRNYLPAVEWCMGYAAAVFVFYWLEKLYEKDRYGKIWAKVFDVFFLLRAGNLFYILWYYLWHEIV